MDKSLIQIATQDLTVAHQESKHLETGSEELQLAISENKISNLPIENLKESLRYVMLLVGLREHNLPSNEEKGVLLNFIKNNYGNHTPAEIRLAFEMAISDKLDLGKQGVTCYENFSCEYFSRIMNSYRKWSSVEIKFIKPKEEKLLPAPPTDWENEWEEYKIKSKTSVDTMIIILPIYDWLVKKEILKISIEEKENILKRARIEFKKELENETTPSAKNNLSRLMQQDWKSDLEILHKVRTRAKILSVRDLLRKMLLENNPEKSLDINKNNTI